MKKIKKSQIAPPTLERYFLDIQLKYGKILQKVIKIVIKKLLPNLKKTKGESAVIAKIVFITKQTEKGILE